ncbi:A24 family peptidase [Candidatus Woesearchaeota archaeon]|nr:A24 family peptidase [Candidatus Woesearchaeota archaeon]
MLSILLIIVLFVILITAAYVDIKTLEVPDWLNYSGIVIGLGVNSIYAIQQTAWQPIIGSIIGLLAGLAFGSLMYYTGQWGGGDAKLLIAVGAIIGGEFSLQSFGTSFLFNLFIFGAMWGIFYTAILGIKNFTKVRKTWKEAGKRWLRILTLAIAFLLVIAGIIFRDLMVPFFILAFAVYFVYQLVVLIKSVERSCMHKKITPDKLTEGDWLLEEVCIDGNKLAGPSKTGLQRKELDALRQKCPQRKICVKYGVPFTPAFLIAFVITLLAGNVLLTMAVNIA